MNRRIDILHIFRNFILICGLFFVVSCSQKEYDDHYFGQRNIATDRVLWMGDFQSQWKLLIFPQKNGQDWLIDEIKNAKERIWVEIYTMTKNEKILESLLEAKNRWVDVRILLEWNVYGSPTINQESYKFFQKNNIPVTYTDNDRYVFTHAKFWLIDGTYYISTGNWTVSFFTKNREYVYTGNDSVTYKFLENIFEKDFSHIGFSQISDIPPQIVISPLNSREKIEEFINNTQKEIFIYVQSVTDKGVLEDLENLQNNGKKVFLCTAYNEENLVSDEYFTIERYFAKNPYLHAKVMLRDDGNIFIGSQNFTKNSLENNREIGIFLENRSDLYTKIRKNIQNHCQK